jgi:predicted protein tyrosine phosphatase
MSSNEYFLFYEIIIVAACRKQMHLYANQKPCNKGKHVVAVNLNDKCKYQQALP